MHPTSVSAATPHEINSGLFNKAKTMHSHSLRSSEDGDDQEDYNDGEE